jgi:hypothetical protein
MGKADSCNRHGLIFWAPVAAADSHAELEAVRLNSADATFAADKKAQITLRASKGCEAEQ